MHPCVSRPLSVGLIQLVSELENYAQKEAQLPQGFVPCDVGFFFFKKGYSNLSFDIKATSLFAALYAALLSKLHSKTIHLCFQLSALKL